VGLRLIRGRPYYFKSVRRGGKVCSEYGGSGFLAVFKALLEEEDREVEAQRRAEMREAKRAQAVARQAQRDDRRTLRKRLESIDGLMLDYHRRIGSAVEAILAALGYHRHARGHWRRRRAAMSNELEKMDVQELVRLAREGDQMALADLSYKADRTLYEMAEAFDGDLARTVVEPMLINLYLGPGTGYARNRQGVVAQLAIMRRDLAPPGSSIAEELLAERAAMGWLHVQFLEMDRADLLQQPDADHRRIAMIDQCLSRAQARFSQALTSLAKVRRLNIPIVFNQVNQQVNIGAEPSVSGPSII
jgi:hypothetical protein